MNPHAIDSAGAQKAAGSQLDQAVRLPLALRSRMANIAYTAQVQMAYACAANARSCAERSIADIEACWPATPLREMVLSAYRSQARSAEAMAAKVLRDARRVCGLAYALV